MLLAINWQIGVAVIISLILITIITDYISVGSISLYIIIPILAYISGDYSIIAIRCAVVLLIVGMIKHWINVKRIMNGTETGLRSVFKKNKTK
jgi:glycerol-3-phosphate acyltransferase PlsY